MSRGLGAEAPSLQINDIPELDPGLFEGRGGLIYSGSDGSGRGSEFLQLLSYTTNVRHSKEKLMPIKLGFFWVFHR